MPPTVQTLDQLMQANSAAYDPQRQQVQQQIGQATDAGQQQEQALYGTQKQAFNNIAQMASNRGMLFSGFTPDQQAQYNATKFMPAMADLRAKVSDNISKLQTALVGIDTEQRKQAMDTQGQQQQNLYNWQQQQDQRKWQEQQNQIAYQQEMAKLKQQQAFQASQSAQSQPTRYTWARNSAGGYDVVVNGQKQHVDLATAVASQGGGISNLVSLLASGDSQDRKAANQYLEDVKKYGGSVAYANLVKNRPTAFYTGGGF